MLLGIVAASVLLIVLIVAVNDLGIAFLVWLGVLTVLLYLKPYGSFDSGTVDEAAWPETVPTPREIDPSNDYFGAGPIGAIVLECIALLLIWPGLISDSTTYLKAQGTLFVYAAMLFSIVIALGSCAALFFGVRARRGDRPAIGAGLAPVATLGLVFSVIVGYGPSWNIAQACDAWGSGGWLRASDFPGMHVACPGSGATFGFPILGGICWLLATLIALGTMIGNLVHFAKGHLSGMIVHQRHFL
jgi:hypothetical protein